MQTLPINPAMRTSLAGRRRPGSVQSVCPGVQDCLHNMAPGYLSALHQPVFSVPGCRHLCSAGRGKLDFFPRVNLSTYGGRAFAYAGPTSWNSPKNINLSLFKLSNVILRHSSFPHTRQVARLKILQICTI